MHSFPNKFLISFFFDAYFHLYCANVALNNSTHSILIISKIKSHSENERDFTDRERDGIPCVIIFLLFFSK